MSKILRPSLALIVLLLAVSFAHAQTDQRDSKPSASADAVLKGSIFQPSGDDVKKDDKTSAPKPASPQPADPSISDPLVRVLLTKGVITPEEARAVAVAGTPSEQRDHLAALLRDKGLISDAEYEAVRTVSPSLDAARASASSPTVQPGAQKTEAQKPEATPTPSVIAAVAPVRLLQVDPPKREGLIPDIKLGTGARIKPYGIFKTSIVHDSSSPGGNDFPLPGFLGDTGPDAAPEFHIRARGLRLGANFEWLDPAPKMVITGRIEFDFEGDFTRANNRNISSIRSSQPSIRLAWARIDRQFTEHTTGFILFGQDWTPFLSSTMPNAIENTNFGGLGYGAPYTRAPQARFGLDFNAGGPRSWKFQPEFALVVPAAGNLPANVADQLGFGERQGPDSERPNIQGRFVTQFQLDRAPGVLPAQLIISFMQGRRTAIVTAAGIPAAFRAAFPSGAKVDSNQYGLSAEWQLPTRFVTVVGKYYNGEDLRFYFGGQLFSTFNDAAGLTGTATTVSIDGSSTVVFGLLNGTPVVAPQRPVRAQGGFMQLGFPLSRIFDADPKGRNAGWTAYLYYGYDQATARDARRFGGRGRGDLFSGNVQYKLNTFVTFALEEGYYRTRAANSSPFSAGGLPLFRGIPSRSTHNVRSEFATIFTF